MLPSRRDALWQLGGGLGGIAMAQLLGENGLAASGGAGMHHPAKARRVIQLFMNGGVSQMDTFDYKPELIKRHGEKIDLGIKNAVTSELGPAMKCPFAWKQHGECGRWVSSVFPRMAKCVDDMAFLMAMTSKTNVHGPASYLQNTGFVNPGFPCLGSWISYGLGRLTDELPAFVVLPDARGLPYNNAGNFSSAFLPAAHQGIQLKSHLPQPIADMQPPASAGYVTPESEKAGLRLLRELNDAHAQGHHGDTRLDARIMAYELAAKMQLSAPLALNLERESRAVRDLYGMDDPVTGDFARSCLMARRLLERGVRFVQVWSGAGGPANNWDNHKDIKTELPFMANRVDRPIAALLHDLKARGLLEDTLVVWTTEFGRLPCTQGSTGRDHNGGTFVSWLAGAGIKGGVAHGASDAFSYKAAEQVTWGYDLHATILHLLGMDHEKLTFRHNGVDRRVTDVHGHVIREILA